MHATLHILAAGRSATELIPNDIAANLGLIVFGLIGVMATAGLLRRFRHNSRNEMNKPSVRSAAEHFDMILVESPDGTGAMLSGLLPDGRGVKMFEDVKYKRVPLAYRNHTPRLVTSVLQVEAMGREWEALSAANRQEAALSLPSEMSRALNAVRGELMQVGSPTVSIAQGMYEIRNFAAGLETEQLVRLIELLAEAAAQAEAACIAALHGRTGAATAATGASDDETAAPGETAETTPWNCPSCNALNPGRRHVCQMCGLEVEFETVSESADE
jgi:hypothetical protein